MIMKVSTFLDDESKWCKNDFAVNADGFATNPCDKDATRWCIFGALLACEYTTEEENDLILAAHEITNCGLTVWQDAEVRTFTEVHKLLLRVGH